MMLRRKSCLVVGRLALAICALGAGASSVFAAGGTVILLTDDTPDGYFYTLDGTGSDRYIGEYVAGRIPSDWIICGARWFEDTAGTLPPPGFGGCDIRLEDPGNPGYPYLAFGLVASADPSSFGTCSSGASPRIFTFNSGVGIPAPIGNHYVSVIQPPDGPGLLDSCGTSLDTSSPAQGFSKYYSSNVFGTLPFNHFVEEIAFDTNSVSLGVRASGSARFPGDPGSPVVYTRRPNATGAVTDDAITLAISIDYGGSAPISRNITIAADRSAINPLAGPKDITGVFRPVGGGAPLTSPITLPAGRTVLRLEISKPSSMQQVASIVNKKAVNLPLLVLLDDPALDVDPFVLEGTSGVGSEERRVGLRRRAGSADDNSMESYFVVQSPNQAGDAFSVRFRAIDMPKVAYDVTGLSVVGGEFGGVGLPGLDALELRTADPVFADSPDLSNVGLLRSFGTRDGVGEVPLGAPPSTAVLDVTDLPVDPISSNPGLVSDLHVLGLFLPGETFGTTGIGADMDPRDTLLGDSTFITSGQQPIMRTHFNFALRLLIDGDGSTLDSYVPPATTHPRAFLREIGRQVHIDLQSLWGGSRSEE